MTCESKTIRPRGPSNFLLNPTHICGHRRRGGSGGGGGAPPPPKKKIRQLLKSLPAGQIYSPKRTQCGEKVGKKTKHIVPASCRLPRTTRAARGGRGGGGGGGGGGYPSTRQKYN